MVEINKGGSNKNNLDEKSKKISKSSTSNIISSNKVGPTIIASKISEIDLNDPTKLKSPKNEFENGKRRKSHRDFFRKKKEDKGNKSKRRISLGQVKKISQISQIFKEPEIDPNILERRRNRRKKFKSMKKAKKKRVKKDTNRIEKYKEMMSKERRIPFHPFTFQPKFLQVDENSPFCKKKLFSLSNFLRFSGPI